VNMPYEAIAICALTAQFMAPEIQIERTTYLHGEMPAFRGFRFEDVSSVGARGFASDNWAAPSPQ
jgi:hypothetical protein